MSNHLFHPFPKQEQFIATAMSGEFSFIFFGGSVRGGKSFSVLGLFILLCHFYPGCKYIVCRKSIEILKDTTLKSFDSIVPASITAKRPSAHNGWEWQHTNGSVIKFFSENITRDPDLFRFRGLEFDGLAFDEMDVTQATFEKAFERLGTWKMQDRKNDLLAGRSIPPKIIVGTSNPQDGWVKKDIHDKYIQNNLPAKWAYIKSRVYDNLHIDPKWIEQQKENMTPEDFLKFMDGDWEVDKNKVKYFPNYNDKIHYSKIEFEFEDNEEIYMSFDFNYNPTTCTVYQVLDTAVICLRNYGIAGGTRKLCELMSADDDLMNTNELSWTITGDTNGQNNSSTAGNHTDYDIIQEYFNLTDAQFTRVASRNKAHVYSKRLCDHFLWKVPFVMDKRVDRLRNDFLIAKPIEGSDQLYKDRKKGFEMDYLDTFRYFVDARFPYGIEDINRFVAIARIKNKA